MQEQMQYQIAQSLVVPLAFVVRIAQRAVQILLAQLAAPCRDDVVQRNAALLERGKIAAEDSSSRTGLPIACMVASAAKPRGCVAKRFNQSMSPTMM